MDSFAHEWLVQEPMLSLVDSSPTGIALLRAVRDQAGDVIDFAYLMANSMQKALTGHPEQDLLNQPLTVLAPDVAHTGVLHRLIAVVETGQPNQYIETYHLDGLIGHYNQLYLKSGDGVLVLTQDVTHTALSEHEQQQQSVLLEAVKNNVPVADSRALLLAFISGQSE